VKSGHLDPAASCLVPAAEQVLHAIAGLGDRHDVGAPLIGVEPSDRHPGLADHAPLPVDLEAHEVAGAIAPPSEQMTAFPLAAWFTLEGIAATDQSLRASESAPSSTKTCCLRSFGTARSGFRPPRSVPPSR